MYNIIKEIELPKVKCDRRIKLNTAKKLAEANGQVYFIGKVCKRGHNGVRYTKGGQCVACVGLIRGQAINPKQRSNENHNLSLNAAVNGQTTYVPTKPCRNGHLLRFVNSNNCVECDKIIRDKHKITQRFNRITREYGLTKNEYLQLVKNQDSSCKLCDTKFEDYFKLNVDHCHETKIVRGLLCNKCNQGIGLFKHNSDLLRKAILYCEAK